MVYSQIAQVTKMFVILQLGPLMIKLVISYVEYRQYLFQCPVYKNFSLFSACFSLLLVLRRADFPFDQVPVPKVTYINDNEIKVTLKCNFTVPPWGNVSFEIQWFVNGKASKPAAQCDDPATSQCSHLRYYQLGSHVISFPVFLSYYA